MRILFCWTGVTSYMADCWRSLAASRDMDLRVIVERTESGRAFQATETLQGIRYRLVEKGDQSELLADGWMPDVLFAGGWRSPTTRRVCESYPDVPKIFCLDMPWRKSPRCILAPLFLRNFLRQFQAVYVPGASTARYAHWLGFRTDRIVRGLYAVNQKRLRGLGGLGDRKGFLFVGRYSPEKRRDLVEKAYARYREIGGTWTIDYYGQGGKFAQAADMPKVYAQHACLVLASSFDPWPLVMLEARSVGLQVVASDRCGNVDELGAIKVRYGDVESMARAMLEVERGKRERLPANFADYDCPVWTERTLNLAQRVISSPNVTRREPNGMLVVDRLLREHGLIAPAEVWVHGMWTPDKWLRCIQAKLCGKKLVRMTHGSLSPIYLERQGKWKKRIVAPIERMLFRMSDRVVVTGLWEREWCEKWGCKGKIEILDLKQFFNLSPADLGDASPDLHILYLGRRHPLKGVEYLERAVEELNSGCALRVVSDHAGEELERDWAWCDVLCLPTLSENFGLVVAEALARGKRVITTDGAPAWDPSVTGTDYGGRLVYLKGFCAGDGRRRVELLQAALLSLVQARSPMRL